MTSEQRTTNLITLASAVGLLSIITYAVITHPAEKLCITEQWCPSFGKHPIIAIGFFIADFVLLIIGARLGLWIVGKLFEHGIAYVVVGLMLFAAAGGLVVLSFVQSESRGEQIGFLVLALLPATMGGLMVFAPLFSKRRQHIKR